MSGALASPLTRLLAFYGDDFTGSTDAMEALALAGLRTVLFLSPPARALLDGRFAEARCIGVAGTSRAMAPAEMDSELGPILRRLWALGAPLTHYKVCSTFDSSAMIGSIGRVIDLAREQLACGTISILAGAPPLRRYTLFGNHFAAAGDDIHRLDRHPTMAHHPVTPMAEADLRLHLAHQTNARIALMSVLDLEGDGTRADARYAERLRDHPDAMLFDVLDDARLCTAGRLMWEEARRGRHFAVGSSGIEYALRAYWRSSGEIESEPTPLAAIRPVDQILVVSGSASPLTAQQIEWAAQNGFECIRAPVATILQTQTVSQACHELAEAALRALSSGRSVLIYTALGPNDPSLSAARAILGNASTAKPLGGTMGRTMRELLVRSNLRRVVIAGGDTSSFATQELGLYGLEMLAEVTPGAPLCRAYSDDPHFDGLEIALKGGQMGKQDYFGRVRSS